MANTAQLLFPPHQAVKFEMLEQAWYDQVVGYGASAFDVVCLDGTLWQKGDSHDSLLARHPIGLLPSAVLSGQKGDVLFHAIISNAAWNMVSGVGVWLASGGGIVASGPIASGDWVIKLGTAVTKNIIELRVDSPPIQLG